MSLEAVFSSYAAFGAGSKGGAAVLESAKFAKLCRESGIIAGKLTPASVDMAFTKAKAPGARTIDFAGFNAALHNLAAEVAGKGADSSAAYEAICAKVTAHGGPSVAGATATATGGGIFSKLTDASKYTGAHKERFDAAGHGLGAEGRREEGAAIHDLSQAVRPGHGGGTHMPGTAAPAIKPK